MPFDPPAPPEAPPQYDLEDTPSAAAEISRAELVAAINQFERAFRSNHPALWLTTLVGPLLFTVGLLLVMGLQWGWALASKFVTAGLITFFILGRFVILVGVDGDTEGWMDQIGLAPGQLFWMLTYMDFMVALFVTFHMGILFRLPWVGPKIAGLVYDGKFIMDRQPWLRRVAEVGLVLFVIFPTSTTGSIGGSIFGRLLGLGRFITVAGVLVGSLLGNGLMYFFAKEINKYIGPDNLWLKLGGILLLVAGVALVEWRYRTLKKKYFSQPTSE